MRSKGVSVQKDLGCFHDLEVLRLVDFGLYLDAGSQDVLLPKKEIPAGTKLGDRLRVFLYTDSDDRPIATMKSPKAAYGEIALMTVVSTSQIGAFADWGLEKDLFIPPKEQRPRMEKYRQYLIKVLLDPVTNRLYGTNRIENHLPENPSPMADGDTVSLRIYRESPLGWSVLINDERMGILYRSEVFEPLAIGDVRAGFIRSIRDDGKIDVSLRRTGSSADEDAAAAVLCKLEEAGGFLPYHYKSAPEDLGRVFGLSRKAFKKALTRLIESGTIELTEEGIHRKK